MKIHMVKKGDSLYLIAQKYNVPLEELIKANPEISNPDMIDAGMKVKIPAAPKPAYEVLHQHKVQQGDTLWKLSKAWGIPLADMIQANPQLKNPNVLLTGEMVNIPKLPAAGAALQPNQSGGQNFLPGLPQWIPGKKDTGIKPETGISITPAPEAGLPAPQPLPAPMPLPFPMPLPPVAATPLPAMPEMPANMMPMPANMMPMPANMMPMPVMPVTEPQHTYPLPYQPDHDLFMQFPVPAMEAGAPAPCPPPADYSHDSVPVYGPSYGHGYGHDYGHDYGHGMMEGALGSVYDPHDISGYGYGDISQPGSGSAGAGSTGVQGMTGYLPAYVPGLVSPSAAGIKPSGGCTTCGGTPSWQAPASQAWPQALSGQVWPQVPSGQVSPQVPPHQAWTQAPSGQALPQVPSGQTWPQGPSGQTWTQVPSGQAWPQGPSTPEWPAAPTGMEAVSPAAPGGYPGTGTEMMMPPVAGPGFVPTGAMPYPMTGVLPAAGMTDYGYEDQHAFSYGYGNFPHGISPYQHGGYPMMDSPYGQDLYPHMVSPYGYDGYPHAGVPYGPAGTAGAGLYPGYPGEFPYCPPVSSGFGIPPIPPLPPLREKDGPDDGDPSLTLHASDSEVLRSSQSASKKANTAARGKSAPARRSKPKRKESLPWIKW